MAKGRDTETPKDIAEEDVATPVEEEVVEEPKPEAGRIPETVEGDDAPITFEELSRKGGDLITKVKTAGREPIEQAIGTWVRKGLAVLDGVIEGLDPKKPKD